MKLEGNRKRKKSEIGKSKKGKKESRECEWKQRECKK